MLRVIIKNYSIDNMEGASAKFKFMQYTILDLRLRGWAVECMFGSQDNSTKTLKTNQIDLRRVLYCTINNPTMHFYGDLCCTIHHWIRCPRCLNIFVQHESRKELRGEIRLVLLLPVTSLQSEHRGMFCNWNAVLSFLLTGVCVKGNHSAEWGMAGGESRMVFRDDKDVGSL